MSAAKDEAEQGPDLSSDDDLKEEAYLQHEASDQSQDEELPTPKLGKPNGVGEDNSLALEIDNDRNIGTQIRNFGGEAARSLQVCHPDPERPSSADGSLSIPDDTPSIQVSMIPSL